MTEGIMVDTKGREASEQRECDPYENTGLLGFVDRLEERARRFKAFADKFDAAERAAIGELITWVKKNLKAVRFRKY
jgi:hypothetical protein